MNKINKNNKVPKNMVRYKRGESRELKTKKLKMDSDFQEKVDCGWGNYGQTRHENTCRFGVKSACGSV
jgi:hypothetical protein